MKRFNPLSFCVSIGLTFALGACGGSQAPATAASIAASADAGDTVVRVGDVTMHASVMQTSTLDAGVAREYNIARDEHTVLLLIAVRKGSEGQGTALPATVSATATDLAGRQHVIAMREQRTGSLLDYLGSVDIALPDTLRFDVDIVREDGSRSRMQFTREFFPR